MDKEAKQKNVSELHDKFAQAKSVVVTGYIGINVEEMTDLRTKLRQAQIEYRVVKNTLAKMAVKGTSHEALKDYFVGPVGVALGYDDPIAVTKVLYEFQKGQAKLELKVGVLDGKLVKQEEIRALATLPSLDALRGKIIGLLQAPASRIVGALSAPGSQIARVLKAKAEAG